MTDSRSWFILATLAITWSAWSQSTATWAAPPHTVRECIWAWSHEAGVYNGNYGLPGNSRITPVEGAHFLGVPNIIFIRYHDRPEPPFQQYAIPFKSLERVVWSITGASGHIARRTPACTESRPGYAEPDGRLYGRLLSL